MDPNCEEPVCGSKMDSFKNLMKNNSNSKVDDECPLDREELGSSTWKLVNPI